MPSPVLLSALEIRAGVASGRFSAAEVVEAHLEQCARVQKRLNLFAAVYVDEARKEADRIDAALADGGSPGALAGVPVAIKDFTPIAGRVTTRGSVAFKDWIPERSAVVVDRLSAAGAVIVGKTTTPEFAHSSFTRSPLFGDTLNPWSSERTPGGSSGGSAAAVATGCAAIAEGTDMGGSVRIPAALCGVVGMKPSLGRIPMDILPTTFDTISHFGPLARTVSDAALFVEVAEGPHDADIMSQPHPAPVGDALQRGVAGLRIAVSRDLGFYSVDAAVRRGLDRVAEALAADGAEVAPVRLGWDKSMLDAWTGIWTVFLAAAAADLLPAMRGDMDPELLALVDRGLEMGAVEYRRLDEARTRQWHALAPVLAEHDALICPTMAVPAPRADASETDFLDADGEGKLMGLDMTALFNSVGQCPAISVPSGFSDDGLPVAVQVVAGRFDDPMCLRVAAGIERLLPWQSSLAELSERYAAG